MTGSHTTPGKILAIEDDASIRDLLYAVLRGAGYQVETADSGTTGLASLETFMPDLILLDMGMPDMDGPEFLRRRSRLLSFRDIPLMVLSARDGNREVLTAIELGADNYMTKPFDPERLLTNIRNLLASAPHSVKRRA